MIMKEQEIPTANHVNIEVMCQHGYGLINENSILNTYPEENIK